MTHAMLKGGDENWRELFAAGGWSQQTVLLADLYDALNINTRATGSWRKKPPEVKPYPRPKVEKPKKKRSVADWYAVLTKNGTQMTGR